MVPAVVAGPRPPAPAPAPHEVLAARLRHLTHGPTPTEEEVPAPHHGPTPTEEEVDRLWRRLLADWCRIHQPLPVSTLTGRPTPKLPAHVAELGPLPADPTAAVVELRRRRGLPPRAT